MRKETEIFDFVVSVNNYASKNREEMVMKPANDLN